MLFLGETISPLGKTHKLWPDHGKAKPTSADAAAEQSDFIIPITNS